MMISSAGWGRLVCNPEMVIYGVQDPGHLLILARNRNIRCFVGQFHRIMGNKPGVSDEVSVITFLWNDPFVHQYASPNDRLASNFYIALFSFLIESCPLQVRSKDQTAKNCQQFPLMATSSKVLNSSCDQSRQPSQQLCIENCQIAGLSP